MSGIFTIIIIVVEVVISKASEAIGLGLQKKDYERGNFNGEFHRGNFKVEIQIWKFQRGSFTMKIVRRNIKRKL